MTEPKFLKLVESEIQKSQTALSADFFLQKIPLDDRKVFDLLKSGTILTMDYASWLPLHGHQLKKFEANSIEELEIYFAINYLLGDIQYNDASEYFKVKEYPKEISEDDKIKIREWAVGAYQETWLKIHFPTIFYECYVESGFITTDFYKEILSELGENVEVIFMLDCLRQKSTGLPMNIFINPFEDSIFAKDGVAKIAFQCDSEIQIDQRKMIPITIDKNPTIVSDKDKVHFSEDQIDQLKEFIIKNEKKFFENKSQSN